MKSFMLPFAQPDAFMERNTLRWFKGYETAFATKVDRTIMAWMRMFRHFMKRARVSDVSIIERLRSVLRRRFQGA